MVAGVDSFPLPSVLRGWLYAFSGFKAPAAGDGLRCSLLQLLPSSWGPAAWRKEDLAGLPSEGVAEDDDGDITGCVRQYSLYWGVSCKKKQGCTVCLFNTVSLSKKKKVSVTCGTLYRHYQLILTLTLVHHDHSRKKCQPHLQGSRRACVIVVRW